MVGDCGQTRHLEDLQSLATRQPSAKMHITKMLVMDWTFWESVHTGLQRWKSHHQKQNRYKKASDSLRCEHTHASEEFGRACSGEERDEPEETKSQPTLAADRGESFPNHLQMGGPPPLFVQDSCAPYLFSCSILAFAFSVSASSQLLCPEAIPQVWTSTP